MRAETVSTCEATRGSWHILASTALSPPKEDNEKVVDKLSKMKPNEHLSTRDGETEEIHQSVEDVHWATGFTVCGSIHFRDWVVEIC